MSVLRIVLIAAVLPAAVFASDGSPNWYPLAGVKSGQILLSSDFLPADSGTSRTGEGLPEGQLNVKLIKAKDLVKSDVFGKSDPYAVLKYANQKDKTPVAKNTQNPEWNHEASFDIPDGPDQTLNIEVFDSDKIGKDKSLGKLDIDIQDLLSDYTLRFEPEA